MSSTFAGAWWKSIPPQAPPPPQSGLANNAQQSNIKIDLESRLQALLSGEQSVDGANKLDYEPDDEDYPVRLWRDAFIGPRNIPARDLRTYVFTHLRHYTLTSLTDKILFLENRLMKSRDMSEDDMSLLISLLHAQAEAVHDFEYMTRQQEPAIEQTFEPYDQIQAKQRFSEFGGLSNLKEESKGVIYINSLATSSRLKDILKQVLPKQVTYTKWEKAFRTRQYSGGRPPRKISLLVGLIASTVTTLAGGALIIIPMVIMSFTPSRTKSIVTVSVSVLLFGFILAAFVTRSSSETFLGTATYAAVLVVLVGSSGTGTG